jgi:hypothetical protein
LISRAQKSGGPFRASRAGVVTATGNGDDEATVRGKREFNDDETARLKPLWKKLVRMGGSVGVPPASFLPLPKNAGRMPALPFCELLELIAKDPQAFILKQGWASVSFDPERRLKELRSLYEHLQARILEMIETLDELRANKEMEIFREVEQDESVIDRIAAAQREGLEREIAGLQAEARAREEKIEELAGDAPF